MTSCAAKSRRDGGKRMSESDSAAKKTLKMIILINCVFQKKFSVTQCYFKNQLQGFHEKSLKNVQRSQSGH